MDRKQLENYMKNTDLTKTSTMANKPKNNQPKKNSAGINWNNKNEVINYVTNRAKQLGMPESFIPTYLAQLNQESGLMHYSNGKVKRGSSGEFGIGQLMPATAKSLGVTDPSDPVQNIDGSIKYMVNALAHFNGDPVKALMAYNGGYGAVEGKPSQSVINKVTNYARTILGNVGQFGGNPTGAAAPIGDIQANDLGERMADLVSGNVDLAQQGIQQYASQPYDPSMALALREQRLKELNDAYNRAITQTPLNPTKEQIAEANAPFVEAQAAMREVGNDAMNRIQGQIGNAYQPYEQLIRNAYEAQIQRLQQANPYTQMGQMAPVNLDDAARALNRQQQTNAMLRANNIAMGGQAQPVDFGNEAQQLAQAQRAAEIARQTGLTPEEYMQGGLADYNNLGAGLGAQNKALVDLYARAQAGDINAVNQLQAIANNLVNQIQQGATSQSTAQHQLRADQLAVAKENAARNLAYLQQAQALDPYMVQGGTDIQKQNIGTAGSMFNTGLTSGTSAAGNLANYEGKVQAADSSATKAPTPQQVVSTMGQVAGMSNDPNAIANWQQGAAQVYSAAGVPDAYILPFLQQNVNTFRPQQ